MESPDFEGLSRAPSLERMLRPKFSELRRMRWLTSVVVAVESFESNELCLNYKTNTNSLLRKADFIDDSKTKNLVGALWGEMRCGVVSLV